MLNINSPHNPNLDLDDELRWILGRPGFTVRGIAETLRAATAYKVDRKHEDEQAVAIHWMLCLYLEHGPKWREIGEKQLDEMRAEIGLRKVS
jgi:hypothetical protein